jgi:uncharacterized cupredoxin-like copper-binding protein
MLGLRAIVVPAGVVLTLVSASCGGGGGDVDVTLAEYSIGTDPTSAEAGDVTFNATNDGPDETHEFVVFKTDLALTDLPTAEDGTVEEDGEGVELIGEIEDVEVGATKSVTLTLAPGNYVFICNIFEEDEQEAHYQLGMRASFTVS